MLQMVRTLAQFSIALEEMNESGENTGDEGGGGGDGGGGEEVVDRDAVDQFRNNNGSSGNLNGNGLCAGSPNGEVEQCCIFKSVFVRVTPVLHICSDIITSA